MWKPSGRSNCASRKAGAAMETPKPKHQTPEKHQIPNLTGHMRMRIGISLGFGFWCLGFLSSRGQFPRRAVIASQKFAGFVVADDAAFLRVPFNFAADEHGNQAEVTRHR